MMKKTCFLSAIVFLLLVSFGFAIKLYNHEKWQSQKIHELIALQSDLAYKEAASEDILSNLSDRIADVEDAFFSRVEYDAGDFNYLAIGNSITVHEKCDYWWNEIGMAASQPQNDYFHLISAYLEQTHEDIGAYAFNFSTWEIQSADRTQTLSALEKYVSPKLNLVTIQLSENASNLDTFSSDLSELIKFIKKKCPNATIFLIDDFWSNEKSLLKKKVAEDIGVHFVSLEHIRGKSEYTCGIGTTVYDDNNMQHTVEHGGVAVHPGDKGMQAIAEAIIKQFRQ